MIAPNPMRFRFAVIGIYCFLGLAFSSLLHAQQKPADGEQQTMKCKLYADSPTISPQTPFKVAVHLDNVPRQTVLTAMTFRLDPKELSKRAIEVPSFSYYAPVNVETKHAAVVEKNNDGFWRYPTRRLKLPEGEAEVSVSIADLYWAKIIWSVLPNTELFHTVADGDYLLSAELGTEDGPTVKCRATELKVSRKR
jgi:hypothetical protein